MLKKFRNGWRFWDALFSGATAEELSEIVDSEPARLSPQEDEELYQREIAERLATLREYHKQPVVTRDRPECLTCQYRHAKTFGGNRLICAVHPYGYQGEGEKCPDHKIPATKSIRL